jgi:hypothetical protein
VVSFWCSTTAYFGHEREGMREGRGVVEYRGGSGAFYSGGETVERRRWLA